MRQRRFLNAPWSYGPHLGTPSKRANSRDQACVATTNSDRRIRFQRDLVCLKRKDFGGHRVFRAGRRNADI
jgi:hypothetical protein